MYDESLAQRLDDTASLIKHSDHEHIPLDDFRGLLRQAASCIRDLSTLLPNAQDFRYRRLGEGAVEIKIKAETDEESLSTVLSFLADRF